MIKIPKYHDFGAAISHLGTNMVHLAIRIVGFAPSAKYCFKNCSSDSHLLCNFFGKIRNFVAFEV